MLKYRHFFTLAILSGLFFLLSPQKPSAAFQSDPLSPSLLFVENTGQFDPRARFLVEGNGVSLWVTEDGLWLTILERDQLSGRLDHQDPLGYNMESLQVDSTRRGVNLHLTFPDNASPTLEPFGRQKTIVSYYTPQGRFTEIPVWSGVRFVGLYPGLDLEISGEGGQLKLELVSVSDRVYEANLQIEGATSFRLENNIPIVSTPLGEFPLPLYGSTSLLLHATAGKITSSILLQPSTFNFPPLSLVPDAGIGLVYSTYLGGSADDQPNTIAVNDLGEVYVAGETYSLPFPSAPGLQVPTHLVAAFVAKINSTGDGLDYLVNLISAGLTENVIKDMVVDSAGNAFVAGFTDSADFPTTPGAYDTVPPAASLLYKAFVMKFNPSGSIVYSTLLGTNTNSELANGIAVDNVGNAYITGYTESATFPTTAGAHDQTLGGTRDVFVTKFNPTGTALVYSTFIGGTSKDAGERIALDAANNVIISGYSEDGPTYPQTVVPIGPVGTWDIVVSKLNAGGTGLLFSTLVGGSSFDFYAQGLVIDPSGNVYVTGETYSTDFPTTPGAFDATLNGAVDTVLFKLNPAGSTLGVSTYLGGSSAGNLEFSLDLGLDSAGHPYIVGYTDSSDFPTTANAYSPGLSGPTDMFVVKFNTTGTGLNYATYLGGSLEDYGTAIAIRNPNEFVIAGTTYSADFPALSGALDVTPNGGGDGAVASFKFLPFSLYLPLILK